MMFLKAHWLTLLAIVALLGALASFPFAYYQLMNWIVLGAGIMTAIAAHKEKKTALMWLFILVAVLFNPLAPMYFRADAWRVLDVIAAVLFGMSVVWLPRK